MNEAATATAIFPFIGMNRSTNPINLDHPPTPSDQPSSTPRRKTSHRPRHRRTRRTTRDRHQPRDGQPTTAINPTTARAGTDEPIPGPFRTSHHPTPPPRPLIPRGRTRKRQPPPRAKQPAPADRGKPDRFTSDHERGVSTGGNSEKRNELPSNAIDTRKPTVISQYPERKTSSQTPDYPQQGNQQRVSRSQNRNGALQSRSENPRPYGVAYCPSRSGRCPTRAGKPDSSRSGRRSLTRPRRPGPIPARTGA